MRIVRVLACCVPLLVGLVGPAWFWDQGCIETETLTFNRQYRADRPVVQKIFDPHANDIDTYQARELSFVFDLIDATMFPRLASAFGAGFTVPTSAFLVAVWLAIVFLLGARRTTEHVDWATAAALLLCFFTCFGAMSTLGVYYRSAKPLLAPVLLTWLFQVRAVYRRRVAQAGAAPTAVMTFDAAITFLLAMAAGLLDRQGAFCVLAAVAILWLHHRWTRQLFDVFVATAAAAMLLQLYNFVVAPLVIHAVNGYWPNFEYQAIPARELLRLPNHALRAIALLVQNMAMLFGGFWIVAVAASVLIAVGMRRLIGVRWRSGAMRYVYLIAGAHVVMFALAIARHGYVYRWIDHRFWYYTFPFLAVVLFGMLLMLDALLPRLSSAHRRLVPIGLVLISLSNLLSLGSYRDTMTSGPWFGPTYAQCQALKASLRSGRPEPALDPAYRAFFDHEHAAHQ